MTGTGPPSAPVTLVLSSVHDGSNPLSFTGAGVSPAFTSHALPEAVESPPMPSRPRQEWIPNGRLRHSRMLRGWSQQDLADELIRLGQEIGEDNLGVSAKTVSCWERGESRPRPPYPKLLVRLFAVTAQDLGLFQPERGMLAGSGEADDVDRRTFLETALGSALLAPHRRALDGLTLDDLLVMPRRYLGEWVIAVPHNRIAPTFAGCLWLAEARDLNEAACDASLILAWMANDLGDEARIHHHYADAAKYAERTGSRKLLTYTLACWSADTTDGLKKLRLADAAQDVLPENSPAILRNYVAVRLALALAHAEVGNRSRALAAMGRHTGPAGWEYPMTYPDDEASVTRWRGELSLRLGDLDAGIPALESVLDTWPDKRQVFVGEELARAYRLAGDDERAQELEDETRELGRRLGLKAKSSISKPQL